MTSHRKVYVNTQAALAEFYKRVFAWNVLTRRLQTNEDADLFRARANEWRKESDELRADYKLYDKHGYKSLDAPGDAQQERQSTVTEKLERSTGELTQASGGPTRPSGRGGHGR